MAARQINENNYYYIFESTWARAPFLGSKLFTVRMLVDAVAAPRFLTRRCIWRSRRKMAEEASESRPPARRGADDKEMPDPTTRIQPFCGRKGSASRASMLCVCSVAWRRGCVAWRVVWRRRGGSGACCGRGGGKEKNPSGECARAVSGRIKYGRSSSEDAQAGGASVRLPRLLYFSSLCLQSREAGCRRNWLQMAEPGLPASAGGYTY